MILFLGITHPFMLIERKAFARITVPEKDLGVLFKVKKGTKGEKGTGVLILCKEFVENNGGED